MGKGWMRASLAFGLGGVGVLMWASAAVAAPTVNAANDAADTSPGVAVTLHVLNNDTVTGGTIDASTLHLVADPAHGSAAVSGNAITYTPQGGFSGTDSFQYSVCATNYGDTCDNATVTVGVGSAGTQGNGGYGGGDNVGTQGTGTGTTGSGGALPFTGTSDTLLGILGAACLAGGVTLFRAGRDRMRSAQR